jgi:indole-3-glycerol phosphate synthase
MRAVTQPAPRDFWSAVALSRGDSPNLIAEIKKSSPSAGTLVSSFDPVTLARVYAQSGAAAISVLTDRQFFGGELEFIGRVKDAVALPVLRKDFIVDEYQILESRVAGADAVLLIAEVVAIGELVTMARTVRDLKMTPLVEVHSAEALSSVLDHLGAPGEDTFLLGINNRNLMTQRTDLSTMSRLASLLPRGSAFVAESGINSRKDVLTARRAGASAILVGQSILRADDAAAKIAELLGR